MLYPLCDRSGTALACFQQAQKGNIYLTQSTERVEHGNSVQELRRADATPRETPLTRGLSGSSAERTSSRTPPARTRSPRKPSPRSSLGEHKPGRIKPGRFKRAALSLQNQNCYICCFLIRPRLYASELPPRAPGPPLQKKNGRARTRRAGGGLRQGVQLKE